MTPERCVFDLVVPGPRMEHGAVAPTAVFVRGWCEGPPGTVASLSARGATIVEAGVAIATTEAVVRRSTPPSAPIAASSEGDGVPTVLVVHALTGDMRVGGPGGWWEAVVGAGRALDTRHLRVICFNNLGSCYGTWGPIDPSFPSRAEMPRPAERPAPARGAFDDDPRLPAAVTTWDQAALLLDALDALGIDNVELATGGSIGGMVTLCLGILAPARFARIAPIASCAAASPWIIAWNHIGRQALLLDPGFPDVGGRGLEVARQLAHATYRAEQGLNARHGRAGAVVGPWSADAPYSVQTYLEHQGRKLRDRFHSGAYAAQLDAMDHHDVERVPAWLDPEPQVWGLEAIRASTLSVVIDSDQLFYPAHGRAIVDAIAARGVAAATVTISSPHGHDAFLIEAEQVGDALRQALALRPG